MAWAPVARATEALMDEGGTFPRPVAQNGLPDIQVEPVRAGRTIGARTNFATIATPDRAAQSRIFARSARSCHPDARLSVLALDPDGPSSIFADCYDLVITVEELGLSGLADMRFRYTTAELCFALKPWLIRHLFERVPGEPIYYFDSDIELFSPLSEAEAALAAGANLVLTPHILRPGPDQDRDRALLRSGSFNAGFLAAAPSAPARGFIAWWCDRVRTGCINDHPEGPYGDQKWLELAPSICDGVMVLRHPGYNFAYWNAHERPLRCLGGAWTAAGEPLRFLHYSQWNLPEQASEQYLARYYRREYEPFARLFAEYQQKVRQAGGFAETCPQRVYREVLAPCGTPVPDLLRRAYERHAPAVDGDAAEVFARAVAVLNAPSKARADLPDNPITVLFDEIWQHYADLRYRFNADQTSGRLAYLQWLAEAGAAELQIPAAFLTPARSTLDRERLRQLEADDGEVARPRDVADPGLPVPPAPADALAGLIAARDLERDRIRCRDNDIKLLVSSNKALRRELHGLRVRRWRDEETVQALEAQLAETGCARRRDADRTQALEEELAQARRRCRELTDEVAALRSRRWRLFPDWLGSRQRGAQTRAARRSILPGEGPFLDRGFRVNEEGAVAGATVKRVKGAPSGMLIFGPYLKLDAGTYAATIEARLYQRLPIVTSFKLEIVCDDARQLIAWRRFHLHSIARWQRFELIFAVGDGEDYADFETRIWARSGTPLEIGGIDLYQLTAPLPATDAVEGAA
jgi:hypothetical protein